MKKQILVIIAMFMALCGCESNTYEDLQEPVLVDRVLTYQHDIKPVIENNCTQCHSVGGVAAFRPLETYDQLKQAILTTDLLDRIQRQNGETGQMPAGGRMSTSDINLVLEWRGKDY